MAHTSQMRKSCIRLFVNSAACGPPPALARRRENSKETLTIAQIRKHSTVQNSAILYFLAPLKSNPPITDAHALAFGVCLALVAKLVVPPNYLNEIIATGPFGSRICAGQVATSPMFYFLNY